MRGGANVARKNVKNVHVVLESMQISELRILDLQVDLSSDSINMKMTMVVSMCHLNLGGAVLHGKF